MSSPLHLIQSKSQTSKVALAVTKAIILWTQIPAFPVLNLKIGNDDKQISKRVQKDYQIHSMCQTYD
jgi:hypothetical protein